ncbi:hypothetical protein Noc_1527 [Nitrosococcus oceani ATCC 19707]|uniref:Uncharacterized protein n=2 Tax=Nitrosococcus oceani TaxID=1229 RepID=Q3JAY4_NITOC|nr:hypothetical protein Noc_1527 [Nitrosococcus oceani ATCC 19707]EDZ67641.1 hypothetical protein NOC27_968 [Nitrosococcus oceani AFC27]KFI19536.1 hypothetical protein IB75_08025 [Nitrosococcus oceani C-27]
MENNFLESGNFDKIHEVQYSIIKFFTLTAFWGTFSLLAILVAAGPDIPPFQTEIHYPMAEVQIEAPASVASFFQDGFSFGNGNCNKKSGCAGYHLQCNSHLCFLPECLVSHLHVAAIQWVFLPEAGPPEFQPLPLFKPPISA